MILGIYTKSKGGEPMTRHASIKCEAGFGLEGDLYSERGKSQGGTVAPKAQCSPCSRAESRSRRGDRGW